MTLTPESGLYAAIASFLKPWEMRRLSHTCKRLRDDMAPALDGHRVHYEIAVTLGHTLAARNRWTLHVRKDVMYFEGRNAYCYIQICFRTKEICFDWWFGQIKFFSMLRAVVNVENEQTGILAIENRDDNTTTTVRYTEGLLPALRAAGVDL